MEKNVDLNPSNKVSALENGPNRPLLKCYYSMHLGPSRRLNSIYTSGLYNEPFGSSRKSSSIHIQDCLVLICCFRACSEGFGWDVKSKLSLQRDFSLDHAIIIIMGNKTAEQQNPFIDERILFTFSVLIFHCTYGG